MRSQKSRSRNKNNRNNNRPSGNIVNRVFDSNGPEGKVRGTPQQIIDKYNQLARDAQLSNDRVATENFQQHAEHYMRLLSEAQREMDAKREEQERQNRERQAERDRERAARAERQERESNTAAPAADVASDEQPSDAGLDVIGSDNDSGLVETPEAAEKPKRQRRPRKQDAEASGNGEDKPAPKPRRPRKPKAEASDDAGAPAAEAGSGPEETKAAE